MKNKITTLFLDIGGVLLSDGWGHNFRHKAAAMFNLDVTEMEARHKLVFGISDAMCQSDKNQAIALS